MSHYPSLILAAMASISPVAGAQPQDALDTIHKTPFQKVTRLQSLPAEVQQELHRALRLKYDKQRQDLERDPEFMADSPEVRAAFFKVFNWKIANPGEPWSPTDDIVDLSLPRRRLIYAGVSPLLWFVFYEHGGIGHHSHLLVIGKDSQGVCWSCWLQFPKLTTAMIDGKKYCAIWDGRTVTNEEGFEE